MSRSQFHSKELFLLRHAWLNLWDERMTTGRINQVAILQTLHPNTLGASGSSECISPTSRRSQLELTRRGRRRQMGVFLNYSCLHCRFTISLVSRPDRCFSSCLLVVFLDTPAQSALETHQGLRFCMASLEARARCSMNPRSLASNAWLQGLTCTLARPSQAGSRLQLWHTWCALRTNTIGPSTHTKIAEATDRFQNEQWYLMALGRWQRNCNRPNTPYELVTNILGKGVNWNNWLEERNDSPTCVGLCSLFPHEECRNCHIKWHAQKRQNCNIGLSNCIFARF